MDKEFLKKCIRTSGRSSSVSKIHKIINKAYLYAVNPSNHSNVNLYPVLISKFSDSIVKIMMLGREITYTYGNKCKCASPEKLHGYQWQLSDVNKHISNRQNDILKLKKDEEGEISQENIRLSRRDASINNTIRNYHNIINNINKKKSGGRKVIRRVCKWTGWGWFRANLCWYEYSKRPLKPEVIQWLNAQINHTRRLIAQTNSQRQTEAASSKQIINEIKGKYRNLISKKNNEIYTLQNRVSALSNVISIEQKRYTADCEPC